MVKYLGSVAVLLVIVGCTGEEKKTPPSPPPQSVFVEILKPSTFPAILQATGQIGASGIVPLYARANGYVQKRHVKEGSYVHQGEILYTLDSRDYENGVKSAKASVNIAEATMDNAKTTLIRIKGLYDAKAANRQELDNAIAAERSAKASLEAANATLEQAKLFLSYTKITAPVNGILDKTKVDVGTYVAVGQNNQLSTIYQNDPAYILFSLSESAHLAFQKALETGRITKKGESRIEVTLSDGTVITKNAVIDFTAPFIDSQNGSLAYRAKLTNADNRLLPGQFVRVNIIGAQYNNALSIPQKAVMTGPAGKFVFVAEANKTASTRPIGLGAWQGDRVLVTSGLKEGERVIIEGTTKLRAGALVDIKQAK